ncbi:tetratricopeptide repeat protein [Sorangium sp. So ce260]|uniref:tetratricopeptide repeat protein n=1 Tax=Sorangium sp. So ce260 TaxID=3133291 RepID=UPI003F5E2F80
MHSTKAEIIDNPTAQDYEAAARLALASGDVAAALTHVAAALTFAPLHQPRLELLDGILVAAPRPLATFPPLRDPFFGMVAVRARVAAADRRIEDALNLIFSAVTFRPDVPYLEWSRAWIDGVPERRRPSASMLASRIARFLAAVDEVGYESDGLRLNLQAALHLANKVRPPRHRRDPDLTLIVSSILRRLGLLDEALRLLNEGMSCAPSWRFASELGVIHRLRDEVDLAIAAWRRAAKMAPTEPSVRLDLGDALLDEGRFREAAAEYAAILARDPEHAWAKASHLYVLHLFAGQERERAALLSLAEVEDPPGRARELAADLAIFETVLPGPADPVAQVVRSALARAAQAAGGGPIRVRVRVSEPAPPSVYLAFALGMRALGREGELLILPETPLGPGRGVPPALWRLDGGIPQPGLRPPPSSATEAVRALAETPFDRSSWTAHARELMRALTSAERDGVPAVLVHPPAPPCPTIDVVGWVFRAQVAAAVLLGALSDEWDRSVRKSWLLSIASGPNDWTAAAAVVALGWIALHEPLTRSDIATLFDALLRSTPPDARPTHLYPLLVSRFRLGDLSDERRRELWRWKRRWGASR